MGEPRCLPAQRRRAGVPAAGGMYACKCLRARPQPGLCARAPAETGQSAQSPLDANVNTGLWVARSGRARQRQPPAASRNRCPPRPCCPAQCLTGVLEHERGRRGRKELADLGGDPPKVACGGARHRHAAGLAVPEDFQHDLVHGAARVGGGWGWCVGGRGERWVCGEGAGRKGCVASQPQSGCPDGTVR